MSLIYFDHAATSLQKPDQVTEAIVYALKNFGGAGRSGHPAALAASRCIFQARQKVATLFNAKPERTVFTANATESLNVALKGILRPGDHVITTMMEHNSVLRPLYELEDQGVTLSIVTADSDGNLCYEEFAEQLQENTKVVVCTHASNLTGQITDITQIGRFCQEHGLLFIVDAAQTAGSVPIDMVRSHIDVLCFTGHKGLLGPQGTGGLCIAENVTIRGMKSGGSGYHSYSKTHPRQLPDALESGTPNAHGIAGLVAGIDFIQATGLETIAHKEKQLVDQFLAGLATIPTIKVYRQIDKNYTAVVAVNIGDRDSSEIADELSSGYGICVRSGAHCAPLAHVALGNVKQGAVRFSFSYFNTKKEVATAIEALHEIAAEEDDSND